MYNLGDMSKNERPGQLAKTGAQPLASLPPGRSLDALVAQKVMGLKEVEVRDHGFFSQDYSHLQDNGYFGDVPNYSTDIRAALEVVIKMGDFYSLHLYTRGQMTEACFQSWPNELKGSYSAVGVSIQHAICLSALKAVKP